MEENLIQYFYCPECDDFYEEHGFVSSFEFYLTTIISNCRSNCPFGHLRRVEKNYFVYLESKPISHPNTAMLCFDIKDFSSKEEVVQFNNLSIFHTACQKTIDKYFPDVIYKGTGDGFIIAFCSNPVEDAIKFCEHIIDNYLSKINFIEYRIGISFGKVFSYSDMKARIDVFGKTVIDASRISDFGNKNCILLSKSAMENLAKNKVRKSKLELIGNCFDKHKKPFIVYNYRDSIIGNSFY